MDERKARLDASLAADLVGQVGDDIRLLHPFPHYLKVDDLTEAVHGIPRRAAPNLLTEAVHTQERGRLKLRYGSGHCRYLFGFSQVAASPTVQQEDD